MIKWKLLVAVIAGLLVAGFFSAGAQAAPRAATSATGMAGCTVRYTVTNQWQGGFGADVTITNVGDAVTGWSLAWTFASGQGVTQAWNATVGQSGLAVTAKNVDYNATIATGASVNFGFNGSWTGGNPVPAEFTLNGISCTGALFPCPTTTPTPPDGTPTTTPVTTGPTTAPTTTTGPTTTTSTTPPTTAPTTRPTTPVTTGPTSAPPTTAAGPIKIWMAGDSTMANPSASCPVGWGAQFGALFNSNASVVNNAVAGRGLQQWLYEGNVTSAKNSAGECIVNPTTYATRWASMISSTTGMRAGDYLFIQFGINDGDSACPRHTGSARYTQLLGEMARAAQARGAHPVFVTPLAAITCSGSTPTQNRGYLNETFQAGTANNVPVVDLNKLSLALYASLRFCPNNGDYGSGALGSFFCNDHTHLETAGARQVATLVATALRDQKIPLASYLR
jgi:lysophospholipase L1-like esterase